MKILIPVLIFICLASCSQQPNDTITPSQLQEKIKDYANVLNDNQKANLFHLINGFEREAGSQLSIITVDSLLGESIHSFSRRKAREWYHSQSDPDNRILITVVVQNKEIAIYAADRLQHIVKKEITNQIILEDMAPRFRKNRYGSGIFVAVSKMKKIFKDNKVADGEYRHSHKNDHSTIAGAAILMKI
jgi:uncharacterized protein